MLWFWWPSGLELRSDDYLAIAYASDPTNVARDFVGPQYGVERLALFYRPIITASVAIDAWIGGAQPFVPLLANVIVHMANSVLLFVLLRGLVSPAAAFAGMAAWSLHPSHTEAISWMVGRVDVYPTLFYLGCLACDVRARESGRRVWRNAAWASFVLALMTKELAFTLPGALVLVRGPKSWTELRTAVAEVAPYVWILSAFLGFRWLVLGDAIGGYEATQVSLLAPLDPFVPLVWHPTATMLFAIPFFAGVLLAGFMIAFGKKGRTLLALALLAVVTALPSAGSAGGGKPERYNYLPNAAVMGMFALGGPVPPILAMLSHAPLCEHRRTQLREVSAEVRKVRERVDQALRGAQNFDQPVFVPAPDAIDGHVAFAIGFDCLGRPPFRDEPHVLLPARAIFSTEPAQQLAATLGSATPFYSGPDPLDNTALYSVNSGLESGFGLEGVVAANYAITIATAQGWLRCLVPGKPMRGRADTVANLRDLLAAPLLGASVATRGVVLELWPSVELAASPAPWVHVTALDARGKVIASANRWLELPFTRDLWRVLDKPKRGNLWFAVLVAAIAFALGRYAAPPSSRSDSTGSSSPPSLPSSERSSSESPNDTENDASARSQGSSSSSSPGQSS